jgi:two-component system chemotaxis response regulator CheY
MQRLKQVSARLRDPATRGDVLSLVIEFAAETFSRVAMFMLRDDVIVGMAQSGLARAGGPGDDELRRLRMPAKDSAWLRAAIASGEAVQAPPSDAGDRRLAAMLGSGIPKEAYIAPIHSGSRVAALLYADDLPEGRPLGDTTALAIVLHEAGLALDRALLERALAEQTEPKAGFRRLPAASGEGVQPASASARVRSIRLAARFSHSFRAEGRCAHPIVEDSPTMRAMLVSALEALDRHVKITEVASGFEALRELPRVAYDLILTDINMPDINGLELVSFVKNNAAFRSIPLVIVSTEGSERDRDKGLRLGADAYLVKPFDPEALQQIAHDLLDRSGRRG